MLSVGTRTITATEAADGIAFDRPLALPRRFAVAALDGQDGMLAVQGPDGQHLLGSPIDPGVEWRTAAALAHAV